ncbi:MAG: hypothetical protein ACREB8_12435 [Pseudolabrys sp.]
MRRTHIAALLAVIVAVPAAGAGSFFSSAAKTCFVAGNVGYRFSGSAPANFTVRIAGAAERPNLRLQLVDDPAVADFVLVDDAASLDACSGVAAIESIRIDPAARNADLTVALSRAPADYKIYVRSAAFSEQDAAALFAAIWKNARWARSGLEFAARN